MSASRYAKPLQHLALSIKILLWYASSCNALRAAIAGLSYCLQFLRLRSGSYCVLHATSFITSFVPLHYTSFAAKPFASRQGIPSHTQSNAHGNAPAFSQACPTILTGLHSASLRHSFTSVAFSPPAAYYLARRPPTSAAFTLRLLIAHSYLISQSIAKVHLHSSAAYVPFGKFTPAASYGAGIVAATWISFFSFIR